MKNSNEKKGLNLNKKVVSSLDDVVYKIKGGWTTSVSRCTGKWCCGPGDCTGQSLDPQINENP